MPFCTSCGKEVTSGNKFCEHCGAPLEQPAAPLIPPAPAPVLQSAPVSPPAQTGGSGKGMLVAGIIVVLVVIAGIWFVGLPLLRSPAGNTAGAGSMTLPPTEVPVTSVPVVTASISLPVVTTTAVQTYEEKYTETYAQVYTTNHAFKGGQREVFSQNLVSPPLYIKFNITPTMDIGEKLDEYGNMINTSYVSQTSWFKVSVYNAGTNELAEEQGFNKGYSVDTKQELMVRAPGNYRVEMSGNDVVADVRILTGKA